MTADRICTLAILLGAVAFLTAVLPNGAEHLDYGTLSPEVMPKALAYVIILLAAFQLVFPLVSHGETGAQPQRPSPSEALRATAFFLLTLLGAGLIQTVGFLIVSVAIATLGCLLMGERRPLWVGLGGVGLPVAIWFVVVFLLDRNLPSGGIL